MRCNIEKYCSYVWVGVCATEDISFQTFVGPQSTARLLGSSGDCRNGSENFSYWPAFIGDYQQITVHLDMTKRKSPSLLMIQGIQKYQDGITYHQSFILSFRYVPLVEFAFSNIEKPIRKTIIY